MKQCSDGFVWKILSYQEAQLIFKLEIFDIYSLYDDESEILIETSKELEAVIDTGLDVGIEVGHLIKESNDGK